MKAERIYKNGNIFTADMNCPKASALAINDGKFIYVGDESGLAELEGEIIDLEGRFIMPAIMDSHVHIPLSVSNDYAPEQKFISCNGKEECLKIIAEMIASDPGKKQYRFTMSLLDLNGEKLTKEDLDAVCPDSEIFIIEGESHSAWVNSKLLKAEGITDETPDIAPGLSYYERDEMGRITGYLVEMTIFEMMMAFTRNITEEQIRTSLAQFVKYAKEQGISAVFEAGTPGGPEFHERVYKVLQDMDQKGELPVYIDGCYCIYNRESIKTAIENMKHFREEFSSGNLRVNTLKIILDGTTAIHTAALVTPYADTGSVGGCLMDQYEIADLLKQLNENGFDLHLHTVGEMAARTVLDAVESVKAELGDRFKSHVTCAHLEILDDADIDRFAKLGVNANFSAWWNAGGGSGGGGKYEDNAVLFGKERALKMLRSKSVWDTGANVCWSSDNILFGDFRAWSPYLGMEGAITRLFDDAANVEEEEKHYVPYPSASERMSHEEMLLGYTIHNAKQLRIEDRKGSITVGKDADFLIFKENLLTVDPRGMSHILPETVIFKGQKMNGIKESPI